MVGLSVVLEGYNNNNNSIRKSSSSSSSCTSQVVNKSNMIKSSPTSPAPSSPNPFSRSYSLPSNRNLPSSNGFLDHCFLCRQKLLPGKDIYMYKGDRAFCSEECRYRQIFMDEEETIKAKRDNCSLAAIKPQHASSSSPSSSRTTSSSRKGANKRANGFAY